jgi:DNA-binding LacI/PurR family transcriptional regulator
VDTADTAVLNKFHSLGLPVIAINSWNLEYQHDAVAQDGFAGGVLAATWLAQRGHQRIGYLGLEPYDGSLMTIERQAGAIGGLARQGLALAPENMCLVREGDDEGALRQARRLLSRKDRPTAILALWQSLALAVAQAAKDVGVVLGRDLDLVGWSVSQGPGAEALTRLSTMGSAAAVIWDPSEMAELCVQRLIQRREDPRLPATLFRVSVRLWDPDSLAPQADAAAADKKGSHAGPQTA